MQQAEWILTVDIGNTQTVVGCFCNGILQGIRRWPTGADKSPAELSAELQELLTASASASGPAEAWRYVTGQSQPGLVLVIASVVPAATAAMIAAAQQSGVRSPIVAGPDTVGIPVDVNQPERVGTDRLANAVAAVSLGQLPAIVMDLGTATTLSVVDSRGHFIGGSISPGLQTSARALHQQTAQLPLSDLAVPDAAIGRHTEDCIRSGLLLGGAAMLEGLASRMEAELGQPATLILTGGLSGRMLPHLQRPVRHEPDLLLKGLYQIARHQLAGGQPATAPAVIGEPAGQGVPGQPADAAYPAGSKSDAGPTPLQGRRIGFIGAGRLGVTLGAYLTSRQVAIAGYCSRSQAAAVRAAQLTASRAYPDYAGLVAACDCILITTPDDQISLVARDLRLLMRPGQWLMHGSGSLAATVLSGQPDDGGPLTASLHPMFACMRRDGQFDGLEAACFGIEGAWPVVSAWQQSLAAWGHPVIVLDAAQKPLYHLANVLAANLNLALISLSCQYLVALGLAPDQAEQAVKPLLQANLGNFLHHGLPRALTGPIDRNDPGTIRKHLAVIPPADRAMYCHLSRQLLQLARQKHPGRDDHSLEALLAGE